MTANAAAIAAVNLRAEYRRLRAIRDDAEERMVFAVAMGDHSNADHWDTRARRAERQMLAAGRAIRAAQVQAKAVYA